jgi:hypothetical protein
VGPVEMNGHHVMSGWKSPPLGGNPEPGAACEPAPVPFPRPASLNHYRASLLGPPPSILPRVLLDAAVTP